MQDAPQHVGADELVLTSDSNKTIEVHQPDPGLVPRPPATGRDEHADEEGNEGVVDNVPALQALSEERGDAALALASCYAGEGVRECIPVMGKADRNRGRDNAVAHESKAMVSQAHVGDLAVLQLGASAQFVNDNTHLEVLAVELGVVAFEHAHQRFHPPSSDGARAEEIAGDVVLEGARGIAHEVLAVLEAGPHVVVGVVHAQWVGDSGALGVSQQTVGLGLRPGGWKHDIIVLQRQKS